MVRVCATVLGLILGGAALAQDGLSPPSVTTEAPVLPVDTALTEAPPILPGLAEAPAFSTATGAEPASDAPKIALETDLTSLVLRAHWVVQSVMASLALALIAVVTVFLFKLVEFPLAFRRLRRARAGLAAGPGLVSLPGDCPLALAARAAHDEARSLQSTLTPDLRASARERLELRLDRIEAGAVQQLRSGSGLLASIGAVGPFVGLFGTVFGIMNSFLAIAASGTTNLSVVAPGIAEALLATGIGLVAAIPAVVLYNAIQRRIAAFRHALADGRAELVARFSRDLDARMSAET